MSEAFKPADKPFPGSTAVDNPRGCDAVIFAAPHGTPYPGIDNRVHERTGAAIRSAVSEDGRWIKHWDFDLGGDLLNGRSDFRVGDHGDLSTVASDGPGNRQKIEHATRAILNAGAVPIMMGGDDSVPIPFIAAFAEHGPITILQIDAHIDWRDERRGERWGFSSTMRRASEMAHVERIVQVGMRGLGSAREAEVKLAQDRGVKFVPARQIHALGVKAALELIPRGARVLITLDFDALDGAIMPAVMSATPGGLTYWHVIDLIGGVAQKAGIAGMDVIEFVPERDHANRSAAYLAGRILVHLIGQLARHA
jgi:agmatinase